MAPCNSVNLSALPMETDGIIFGKGRSGAAALFAGILTAISR